MAQATSHRQLLMTCEVINSRGERSVRYVEHDVFPLWQYLVHKRHGLQVGRERPCMWVPQDQWRRSDRLFARAGKSERVARVTFRSHDQASGITRESVRFVADRDFDAVVSTLIPQIRKAPDADFSWDIEAGGAVPGINL